MNPPTQVIEDVACIACACICDDIALTVRGSRVERAEHACEMGETWFLQPVHDSRPDCLIDGRAASVEDGIVRAVQILRSARYPLVCGLRNTIAESQAAAASIADWLGACLDSTCSASLPPIGITLPGTAEITATLGEVRNRSDLVVFWGTDPVVRHPRHLARYSLDPRGTFVPNGRTDRTCIVVDSKKTATAKQADLFLKIKLEKDFESLWTLRALAKGIELDGPRVKRETGIALTQWQDLWNRLKSARYGVFFYGRDAAENGTHHASCDALFALVRDLNRFTRFVAIGNRGPGNELGAVHVSTWRTGFPGAVNLARGYPRYGPGEYTAEKILTRGEADAALIIASDPIAELEPAARRHLQSIPYISIDRQDTPTQRDAAVAFNVASYGIQVPGTVYRTDHVPLQVRPVTASQRASDLAILNRIESILRC